MDASKNNRCIDNDQVGQVGNLEFIQSVFHALPEGAAPVVAGFLGDPHQQKAWAVLPVNGAMPATIAPGMNQYFSIASVRLDTRGTYRRKDQHAAAVHALVLDDVGSGGKVDPEDIALPPSWELETSPDNCQWGYILQEPCEDLELARRVIDAMALKGLTDKGAKGVVRLVRLPEGANHKAAVVEDWGEPFRSTLHLWRPERRYSVGELIAGLGLDVAAEACQEAPREATTATTAGALDSATIAMIRKIAWDAARRTHDDPGLGRHAEVYRIANFLRRDGIPGTGEVFGLALREFSEHMRKTDSSGQAAPMDWKSELKTLADGYHNPSHPDQVTAEHGAQVAAAIVGSTEPEQGPDEVLPELLELIHTRRLGPRPNWDPARIRGALGYLDPTEDLSMVLMALHHGSGGDLAGLELLLEWVGSEATPEQRDAIDDHWSGLDPFRKKPITLRSIFKAGREQGWDGRAYYPPRELDLSLWCATRYHGEPPPRRWLVRDILPLGVAAELVAQGEVGKSMFGFHLALAVACPPAWVLPDFVLGGPVCEHGTAIVLTAEDDAREVHERLANLDPKGRRFVHPERLIVVPLPDAGGPLALVTDAGGVPVATPDFDSLLSRLKALPDLRLIVIDPLQAFVAADVNADPATGQFVANLASRTAAETGATVLWTHHMRKTAKPIDNPQEAREAIRGTTALVDGVRMAYALWPAPEDKARRVCRELQIPHEPNRVVEGAVVKANFRADRRSRLYVRNEFGLLVDQSDALRHLFQGSSDELKAALVPAIESAANDGQPFTKTGRNGLHARRNELGGHFGKVGRDRLERMADELLAEKRIVQCLAAGSTTVQWLDVPSGRFAQGLARHKAGARVLSDDQEAA